MPGGTRLRELVETLVAADVTVAVYREFGRRVRPNNSGTNHGAGGTALLLGNGRAGDHGDPPLLDLRRPGRIRDRGTLDRLLRHPIPTPLLTVFVSRMPHQF